MQGTSGILDYRSGSASQQRKPDFVGGRVQGAFRGIYNVQFRAIFQCLQLAQSCLRAVPRSCPLLDSSVATAMTEMGAQCRQTTPAELGPSPDSLLLGERISLLPLAAA